MLRYKEEEDMHIELKNVQFTKENSQVDKIFQYRHLFLLTKRLDSRDTITYISSLVQMAYILIFIIIMRPVNVY